MQNAKQPIAAGEHQSRSLLYVDLDGSLIKTDLLLESLLAFVIARPLRLFRVFSWLSRGRAYLKARLAEHWDFDPSILPYREDLTAYLRSEAASGRTVILATAATEKLAVAVAEFLGCFAKVLASSESRNLKGAEKAAAIQEDAGGRPYVYVGNDSPDLKVWRHSAAAVIVQARPAVAEAARRLTSVEAEFSDGRRSWRTYVRAIRAHQWTKNALVFVPLLTAHAWTDGEAVTRAVLAFFGFSLCASAIYVLNDLADLAADRRHPRKRFRPLAAGAVPIQHGLVLVPLLLFGGAALGAAIGPSFLAVLGLYVLTTVAYSIELKTYVLIDVIVLAALYTVRIIGGAVAIAVAPSFWLLAFSMFVFLSLALIKRCTELQVVMSSRLRNTHGRNYLASDLPVMQALGVASGFSAVLVFALFIDSDNVTENYSRPEILWLLCVSILYWIGRMWVKTAREEMHDDPLVYALKDRGSLVMLVVSVALVVAAT